MIIISANKKLNDITGKDILNAYISRYGKIETESDRKQFTERWQGMMDRIQKAVVSGNKKAFRKEVSLSPTNYFGKVTRAIMDVMGILRAKNISELFTLMDKNK